MKKISVIIPCFNGEKTLSRCLDSILAQTYKNFEVIIVDDGSSDGSVSLIEQYTLKDSRITLVAKANGGVGSARNLGLKHASGDFIQFIDCDDDIHADMFEKMLEALQKTGSDIAVCRFTHSCFKAFLPAGIYDMQNKADFNKFYTDFFSFNVPWNKLYKRKVITENYDETLKIFEDGLFVLANLKNAGKIVLLDDAFYNYYNPAKDAGAKEATSAVNNFLKTKFWKTKDGYWYKFNNIKPMFDNLLKAGGHNDKVLEYARAFDMAFWELIKLMDSDCIEKICILEMISVLNQPNFIKSIKAAPPPQSLVSKGAVDLKKVRGYKGASRRSVYDFVSKCFKEYRLTPDAHIGALYDKFVELFYSTCLAGHTYLFTTFCLFGKESFLDGEPVFNFLLTPVDA